MKFYNRINRYLSSFSL